MAAQHTGMYIAVPAESAPKILGEGGLPGEGYRCSRRRRVPAHRNRDEALRAYKRFQHSRPHSLLEIVTLPPGVTMTSWKGGLKLETPHLPAQYMARVQRAHSEPVIAQRSREAVSLAQLLNFGLDDVRSHLVLSKADEQQLETARKKVDMFVRDVMAPVAIDVYCGGSVAKRTAVRGNVDLDMVVTLSDEDMQSRFLIWKEQLVAAIRNDANFELADSRCEHLLRFKLSVADGHKVPIDLSFTAKSAVVPNKVLKTLPVDHNDLNINKYTLAFRAYYSKQNDEKMNEFFNRYSAAHLRELVVLTKAWKKLLSKQASLSQEQITHLGWCKSMHLELACVQAVEEMGEGQGFRMSFGRVLTLLRNGFENAELAERMAVEHCYHGVRAETKQVMAEQAALALQKIGISACRTNPADFFAYLTPAEVRFTQQNCSNNFSNRHGQGGKSIGDTARELAAGEIQKRDVEMIRVVEHDDGFTYSVDNRRLAVFRLLCMLKKTRIVKARIVAKSDLQKREWRQKFSTQTNGRIVSVSGCGGQEKPTVGVTVEETTYPLPLLGRSGAASTSMDSMSTLETLSHLESDDEEDESDISSPSFAGIKRRMQASS